MTPEREQSDELSRQAQRLVASEDHVDLRVELDWEYVGPANLDPETEDVILPDELNGPGIYRVRSGRRGTGGEFDCWYVGRSMVNMEGRVKFHATEDFDEEVRCLKRFKSNLEDEDGWLEIDRASNIRVNRVSTLLIEPPTNHKSNPDEWEVVELVFNLIESVGLASTLSHMGRASKK